MYSQETRAAQETTSVSPLEVSPELRALDRLASLGTVSASTAHEMKNALVAVKTFVDLLLEKQPEADLGPIVKRELSRVEALIAQTLRYASPRQSPPQAFSLKECLSFSIAVVQPLGARCGIIIERQLDAARDTLMGHDAQLQQVFVNLLLNALESIGEGGTLRVNTRDEHVEGVDNGRNVLVAISDSGPGIAEELHQRVFDPFFTTKRGGTGLGLAISRKIVEEHRGAITLRSVPGQGATFEISLPVCPV